MPIELSDNHISPVEDLFRDLQAELASGFQIDSQLQPPCRREGDLFGASSRKDFVRYLARLYPDISAAPKGKPEQGAQPRLVFREAQQRDLIPEGEEQHVLDRLRRQDGHIREDPEGIDLTAHRIERSEGVFGRGDSLWEKPDALIAGDPLRLLNQEAGLGRIIDNTDSPHLRRC